MVRGEVRGDYERGGAHGRPGRQDNDVMAFNTTY